jgi:hypothetical protein
MKIPSFLVLWSCSSVLAFKNTLSRTTSLSLSMSSDMNLDALRSIASSHKDGDNFLRLFHPAFPTRILEPLSLADGEALALTKQKISMSGVDMDAAYRGLPWEVLPSIGIQDSETVWSRSQCDAAFEKFKHCGHIIWAVKSDQLQPGSVLLNHWNQRAILITEYGSNGAVGKDLLTGALPLDSSVFWPPAALEIELKEKKWQICLTSENLKNGEVLSILPPDFRKGAWELIFLLITPSSDTKTIETLFDTGLSPRQGFISYLRLLDGALKRSVTLDEV